MKRKAPIKPGRTGSHALSKILARTPKRVRKLFTPYKYTGPGADMGVRAEVKSKPLPPERATHYSDGQEVQWFVVMLAPHSTAHYCQLHTEDPHHARDAVGRRIHLDELIIYAARLSEAEHKLGFDRLRYLYDRGLRPGKELALAIELQEPLP